MTTDRDEMIVEACLAGDRKAFEVLVDRYEKKLYNASYRIVGDADRLAVEPRLHVVQGEAGLFALDPGGIDVHLSDYVGFCRMLEAGNNMKKRRHRIIMGP